MSLIHLIEERLLQGISDYYNFHNVNILPSIVEWSMQFLGSDC